MRNGPDDAALVCRPSELPELEFGPDGEDLGASSDGR
jgi:hypothetical protein